MKYICDCMELKDHTTVKKVEQGRGKFAEVPVDAEGICQHCGHYAMAFRELPNTPRLSPTVILDNLYCETNQSKLRRKAPFGILYYQNYEKENAIDKFMKEK